MTNIVILGATGNFGTRIARRITDLPGIRLTVTSRSQEAADALAATLVDKVTQGNVVAAALDQDSGDFDSALASLNPEIVIHTAGPYQQQGYRVAKACIDCGSHYIDLADGRQFVREFSELDEPASARNVLLVSGASTLPGLSSAVVDRSRGFFKQIESIRISIAPAHQTPRGLGTVAAVLSYCGKPFDALIDGAQTRQYGWQGLKRIRYEDLGLRLAAACDVPDLDLFPQYISGLKTVTFDAALEARWEQLALWIMAATARIGMMDDWSRYAPTFHSVGKRLISLGSDRGGMQIELGGVDADGQDKVVKWILTAGRNHGPEIPCTPALILARKLASGEIRRRGAMPCWNLFDLEDFDREVRGFDIHWRFEGQGKA